MPGDSEAGVARGRELGLEVGGGALRDLLHVLEAHAEVGLPEDGLRGLRLGELVQGLQLLDLAVGLGVGGVQEEAPLRRDLHGGWNQGGSQGGAKGGGGGTS